jgi:hypothetical protein
MMTDRENGISKSNGSNKSYGTDAIKYAIKLATANATSVVEKIGATPGILTKKELDLPRWNDLKVMIEEI